MQLEKVSRWKSLHRLVASRRFIAKFLCIGCVIGTSAGLDTVIVAQDKARVAAENEIPKLPDGKPTEDHWFKSLDQSKDSFLNHDEFLAYEFGGNSKSRHRLFLLYDGDDDGKLSYKEFLGLGARELPPTNENNFRFDDVDLNGFVSFDEFHLPTKEESRLTHFQRWFDLLDLDADGGLSKSEYTQKGSTSNDEIAFARKDINADDRLTFAEFFVKPKDANNDDLVSNQQGLFGTLDSNHDEELDRSEFSRRAATDIDVIFALRDKNGDGQISRSELYKAPVEGSSPGVTKKKLRQSKATFENGFLLSDIDGDGFLSLNEFAEQEDRKLTSNELKARSSIELAFRDADEDADSGLSKDEFHRGYCSVHYFDRAQADRLFKVLDANEDACIELDELKRLSMSNASFILALRDQDGSQSLSFEEFTTGIVGDSLITQAKQAFEISDTDSNNQLSIDELLKAKQPTAKAASAGPDKQVHVSSLIAKWTGSVVLSVWFLWCTLRGVVRSSRFISRNRNST